MELTSTKFSIIYIVNVELRLFEFMISYVTNMELMLVEKGLMFHGILQGIQLIKVPKKKTIIPLLIVTCFIETSLP